MAEKNTSRAKKTGSNRSGSSAGGRQHEEGGSGGFALNEAKMERLYDVLEAFIDTLDIPRNKGRAIKYGIRAIGEFMTPENETGAGRRGGNQGNTRASLADDEQQSTTNNNGRSDSSGSESSGSMRRG